MSLIKSTAVVGMMTMLSRVLGLIRDMVIARIFGAGVATDAFFVAFKIPNFLRRLFAEGAFSQAFVPVLGEVKAQQGQAEVKTLIQYTAGTLGGILLLLSILAALAAPLLVSVFATGFLLKYPDKFDLTVELLRVTFPYILFISLTALASGILNTYGRFAGPAFTPVLLNLSLIACALWMAPYMSEPVMALGWGVFIAGVVQLAFQLPFLMQLRVLSRPRWGWRNTGVRRIIRLMLPGIVGSSAMQINLLLDTVIASFLVTGSVTWLYFSDRLMELPLGVFGIAIATVILPRLSQQHATADPEAFSRTLDWALRWVVLIMTPAMLALVVLAGPILSTLFQHGQFGPHDVQMARISLICLAFGLLGFTLVKVLAPGYYARQDTRTPVRIALIAMAVNMICNLAFVVPMVKLGYAAPHAGLALATTVSSFVNAGLLLRGLKRQSIFQLHGGWWLLTLRVFVASTLLVSLLWYMSGPLSGWLQASTWTRVTDLSILVISGVAVYFLSLFLTGWRPGMLWHPQSDS